MSSFTIEKSPKREEINKGNNFENQYDQLGRNPLGESKVHNEIKHEMVNQSLSKTPRIDTGMGFLRKEKSVNPLEENLKERDNYVVRGTFGRNIDKIVAKGQASLVLAGYDLGKYGYKGVDGVKGELTKKAVIEFQTAVGLKPTGEFDQDTMKALDLVTATKLTKAEIEAIGKKVMQGQEVEKPAASKREAIKPLSPKELTPEAKKRLAERDEKIGKIGSKGNYQYAQVEASLEMMGYKNNKPIDGQPDRQTFENIKQFQKDTGLPVTGKLDPDTYYMLERKVATGWVRPGLEKPQLDQKDMGEIGDKKYIRQCQDYLLRIGFPCGKADGVYGDMTRGSIEAFQKMKGLEVTGKIDSVTLKALEEAYNNKENIKEMAKQAYERGVQFEITKHHTRSQFVNAVYYYSIIEELRTGIPAEIKTAQIVHETGYGKSVPIDIKTGQYSYNLCGIKGKGTAGSVACRTWEEFNGKKVTIIDNFKAYNNFYESIKDHSKFLIENKRYKSLWKSDNPIDWAYGLQKAGYATDSKYAQKLINTMKSLGLIKE